MAPRQRLGEAESTGIPTFPLRLLKSLCSHRADEKMSLASSIAKAIWGGVVRGKVKRSRGDGSSCSSSSSSSSSREKAATAAVSGTRLRADRRSGEEGGAGCDAATPGGEGVTAASTSREDVADVDDGSPADEQQKQKQQQQQQDKAELPSARSVSFNEVVKEVVIANRRQMYGNKLSRSQHFYSKAELAFFKRAWYRHLTLARGPVDRLLRCGCPGCNKGEGCLPPSREIAADDYKNRWMWEA